MKKVYLTREEKERKVIELLQGGANIRQISRRVRMSFTDIGKISRKISGYPEPADKPEEYNKHSQALEMFRTGHSNLQVAIKLGLSDYETIEKQNQFRRLINMDTFCDFYDLMKDDLDSYLHLEYQLKNANLTVRDAIEGLKYARWLESMKFEYGNLQNRLQQMRDESFHVWQTLQALKQEKLLISNQSGSLKEMGETYSNETYFPENPSEGISFVARRRRRYPRGIHSS
jgi:hypothetical protein